MLRLPLFLLLVSMVLAIVHSAEYRIIERNNMKPDSALTNNFLQRRRLQQPRFEIKEENAARYFRRRPPTTTVPSIFSMKVDSESQHVYPNTSQLENVHVKPTQVEINMKDNSIPTQELNLSSTTNFNNPHPNNVRRLVSYRRKRPSTDQTTAPIIQQVEEITEHIVTSTTNAPIVVNTTVKEQGKVVSVVPDSKHLIESFSLESHHSTISQIPEAIIQKMEEKPEQVINSTSSTPVVISTIEKESVKPVFTPASAHLFKLIPFMKRRRPKMAQKITSPIVQEKDAANVQTIDSTTTTPISVTIAAKTQENIVLSPNISHVSVLVPTVSPKIRRPFNRGSRKFRVNDFIKDTVSDPSQVTSKTNNTPPPVPTLSPWYDGFGK